MAVKKQEMTFEAALAELESIVQKMETGELALEESVQAYARGNELMKICRRKLDAAQAKIQKLDSEGTLSDYADDSVGF